VARANASQSGRIVNDRVNVSGRNRLLQLLPAAERNRILERCETLHLEHRKVLYKPRAEIQEAYFPLSGMVSLVISSKEGQTVEIGAVGNEGMLGSQLVLGAQSSQVEAIVQVTGDGLRMRREDLEREVRRDGGLRRAAQRFAQALSNQIAQSVLCNRVHSVEERLCRWFLMTHDRAGADEIILTQQFVAQMLGVRRPSVTVAVGMLQKAGLITYSRGRLGIVDRQGLEAGACECYETVRQQNEALLA
jgi:CRP-like cAMP-binding protein